MCVCVCVCLRDGREGQGSREQQVASATRRGHDGDAHSAACAAAAPPAAPRRISGALSESGCAAQPAEHAPDERRAPRARRRRRGRRADARVVGVGSAGEARRPAPAPAGGCSERSEVKDTVERLESSLPSSSAPRKPAAGDPIGELVVMVAFSAPSRPRRPAPALSAFPDTLSRLYRVPRACWAGSRRATSHAGSSRAASSKTRAERRRAWRARPLARGRRRGSQASWRLCQALTCQKTPRSARDVPRPIRPGAARASGGLPHQARGRRAHSRRQRPGAERAHRQLLWRGIEAK